MPHPDRVFFLSPTFIAVQFQISSQMDSGLQNETSANLQRKRESKNLNLPRSVYTLTLWVMGKFTTPTPPIPTTSFITAAIDCGPACLAVFATIKNSLVDAWEITLVGLFLSEI